ncbi:mandelate racemase/muconate lactonizing enzyme family protein [Alphaproteobacteria bacterium]|jgi:L-alanine-DL-glutamate epimerase-like enolase superfamily enzyme|nr:mandelate racemase/muconate lactonizing enzyme family protein [Rhodospirillaceae bacterium]MBT6307677.1 mandelate racemase/muconate lactonizing enzyme family protein [Rhodospirillaceae bacterium]MDC0997732.1 mandelate racemase/muconate lactonizing enzyme family protein [Alphaproteobacteria bacterium]
MSSIIKEIEFSILTAPDEKRPHWVSLFKVPSANELLVRMKTDDGVEGFGLATSYTDITPLVNVVKGGLSDEILGMDALSPERLYEKLFGLTFSRKAAENSWGREALIRISSAVDIACWDIVGKTANLPLYRLFGGYRNKVPCYVTCAYYRDGKDNAELRDEIQMLVEQGHKGFKGKVGGLSLNEDIARMEIVREMIGPDNDLMIDVNRAWDIKTAIEGARLLEPLKPVWLEEPVRWTDDRRELKLLSQQTNIPLSGGESEITSYGCRAMIEEQAIQILQFDCTMFGGFTEGRKLAALCELNHVDVAPHHDCFIHAPLVAGTPAGRIVESFTDPERDPLQAELYENPPHIAEGWLTLNEAPGLGLTLSESAIKKFGTRVS